MVSLTKKFPSSLLPYRSCNSPSLKDFRAMLLLLVSVPVVTGGACVGAKHLPKVIALRGDAGTFAGITVLTGRKAICHKPSHAKRCASPSTLLSHVEYLDITVELDASTRVVVLLLLQLQSVTLFVECVNLSLEGSRFRAKLLNAILTAYAAHVTSAMQWSTWMSS